MPLNILIIGAGICGPTAALMLLRSDPDHRITVVERAPSLRAEGQQIDLRAQGIPLMRRLGLLDAVRAKCVPERGVDMLDRRSGRRAALLAANDSGQGPQSFTSEYEFMRGDIVEILYRASLEESEKARARGRKGHIRYVFGTSVVEIAQDGGDGAADAAGVEVTFDGGDRGRYDLVVGADGQQSRTRQQIFGKEASDASVHYLGVHSAFYSIPAGREDEAGYARAWHAPGGRVIITRPSRPGVLTGSYLMVRSSTGHGQNKGQEDEVAVLTRRQRPAAEQKEAWAKLFRDTAAGETASAPHLMDRVLRGLDEADDFYAFSLAQVKLEHIVRGRVALAGDAGYVASPATGMGTTLCLVGSYVLAGELTAHRRPLRREGGEGGEGEGGYEYDVPAALRAYEETLRPFVVEIQKLPPGFPGLMLPRSELGIALLHWIAWFLTTFRIDKLLARLMPENKGSWAMPEYPGLKLDP